MGRFGLVLLVLVAVAVGGGYLFLSRLDGIAKRAIEENGSAATKTAVTVGSVSLGVFQGKGAVNELKVANPEGFSALGALTFDNVSVTIDAQSVLGSGPILIHEVVVDKPSIAYEGQGVLSNLGTIQRNVRDYADAMGGGGSRSGGRKLVIENLYLRDGHISISHPLLGAEALSADLPEIHLKNIGKGGGTSAAAVTTQVLNAVLASAMKIAVGKLVARFGPMGQIESLGGLANPLKDLLGAGGN
ncbi:MAG: hypothetical protein U1E87_08420 [Alphaproteobacteria bacterium]